MTETIPSVEQLRKQLDNARAHKRDVDVTSAEQFRRQHDIELECQRELPWLDGGSEAEVDHYARWLHANPAEPPCQALRIYQWRLAEADACETDISCGPYARAACCRAAARNALVTGELFFVERCIAATADDAADPNIEERCRQLCLASADYARFITYRIREQRSKT